MTDRSRKRGERKEKDGEKARERWRKEKAGECWGWREGDREVESRKERERRTWGKDLGMEKMKEKERVMDGENEGRGRENRWKE